MNPAQDAREVTAPEAREAFDSLMRLMRPKDGMTASQCINHALVIRAFFHEANGAYDSGIEDAANVCLTAGKLIDLVGLRQSFANEIRALKRRTSIPAPCEPDPRTSETE